MLHSLVAPVIIFAASMLIASSCFFDSVVALSQTESQYSNEGRTKDMYIFSKDFLLTLNLSVRSRFSRAQAFVVIVCICSDQVHVFESVSPRCLCVSVSVSMMLFMSNGGWCGRCNLQKISLIVFFLY